MAPPPGRSCAGEKNGIRSARRNRARRRPLGSKWSNVRLWTASRRLKGEMSEPLQLTTLGEALIVMDPLSKGPLRHVGRFEKHLGGAEFNVAVGLSRLGHGVGWAGRLGGVELGMEILAIARGEEVEVSRSCLVPEAPTCLFFKEWSALGQLRVHYYRAGSAACRMQIDRLDVQYLLSG